MKVPIFALFSLLVLLLCAGCSRQIGRPHYAQEAFLEQQAQKQLSVVAPELNEEGKRALLLDSPEGDFDQEWARRSYENVEQWLERLREQIALNADILHFASKDLEGLQTKKEWFITQIQMLTAQNQDMTKMIRDPDTISHVDGATSQVDPGIPFIIHLVREGDNLFSIAMKYYGTTAKMPEILKWNQGWIRSEDQLIAGVGVVLFPEIAEDTQPQVVKDYLKQIRWEMQSEK